MKDGFSVCLTNFNTTLVKSEFGNKLLQTDLGPVASSPVSRTGDVCVAGGERGGFGHVFTLAGRQSFLLVHTHCLNAEHRPLGLT